MISGRKLSRGEISRIWSDIDRSEVIDGIYQLERGSLQLRPVHDDVSGWPPGEADLYAPILQSCHDREGWFHGLFDEGHLFAIAVLESQFMGKDENQLQLKFLYVSRPYRGQGWGQRLFGLAKAEAAKRGAKSLYVSATPSKHAIDFYQRLGCTLAAQLDPTLYELEPEDIHLDCVIE